MNSVRGDACYGDRSAGHPATVSVPTRGAPSAEFAQRSVLDWLPVLEEGFVADGAEPADARQSATLTLAVIRGLFMDLHALEDTDRVNAAHGLITELLRDSLLHRVAQ